MVVSMKGSGMYIRIRDMGGGIRYGVMAVYMRGIGGMIRQMAGAG